jgi:hypothetical protein
MAITASAPGSLGSPVERLRSLTDTDVTITTHDGGVTGTVLSCTRVSVWLVVDDLDVVVSLDDIVAITGAGHASAA